ncbi:hypothetical protein CS8_067380 [Cupriavidus sp. 8B]
MPSPNSSARCSASVNVRGPRWRSNAEAYRGRRPSLSEVQVAELRRRVEASERKAQLARDYSISRETLYQYLRSTK